MGIAHSRRTHPHTCLCQRIKCRQKARYSFIYFQANGIVLCCEKQTAVNKDQAQPTHSQTGLRCDRSMRDLGVCISILLYTEVPRACFQSFSPWASWASLVAQRVKSLPAKQETMFHLWVGKIPWKREWLSTLVFLPGKSYGQRSPGGLQSVGSQRIRHD